MLVVLMVINATYTQCMEIIGTAAGASQSGDEAAEGRNRTYCRRRPNLAIDTWEPWRETVL